MTDLERDWDDLPVGPAPMDAILREGRRSAARRGRRTPAARLRRSVLGAATVGGIAAAFVAGTIVAAPDGATPSAAPPAGSGPAELAPGVVPAAFQGELQAPESCADLLASYVDAGVDLVTAYGWTQPYSRLQYVHELSRFDAPATPTAGRAPAASGKSADVGTSRQTSSDTGTNVQEAGVDEPDSVKTDGEVLVRLDGATLTTYDVSGAAVRELGVLDLGDFHDGEILLSGDTVVAIGNDGTRPRNDVAYDDAGYGVSPQTRVVTIDLTDAAAPDVVQTLDYGAASVTARQHGDAVRLVLSAGLPDLDFVTPGRGKGSRRTALATNRTAVEESTLDDWLPRVSIDGGAPAQLLDCDRVALPRAELGLGTMAVVGFSASVPVGAPGDLDALGLAGQAPLAYESADHLYLAASPSIGFSGGCFDCLPAVRVPSAGGTAAGTTHVYDFALDGTAASYVGAGEVEGTVADRWAMDEHDGVLRLAVGPSAETGDFNAVVTLRADGDELVEIGRLDKIARGEQITSVRWFDGLALLVTYRQVDPLFAIDLSDQQDPTLIGQLKIPGFSSYLHPLGSMRVVGIGEGPQGGRGRWGAQAGLFDVTDLTDLTRLDVVSYGGGTRALAGDDPRQFTWLPGSRTVLTVIERGRTGYVSSLRLGGGRFRNTMTQVEYGSDVAAVRLVPLPDDKVALVTGDDVEFFTPTPDPR